MVARETDNTHAQINKQTDACRASKHGPNNVCMRGSNACTQKLKITQRNII